MFQTTNQNMLSSCQQPVLELSLRWNLGKPPDPAGPAPGEAPRDPVGAAGRMIFNYLLKICLKYSQFWVKAWFIYIYTHPYSVTYSLVKSPMIFDDFPQKSWGICRALWRLSSRDFRVEASCSAAATIPTTSTKTPTIMFITWECRGIFWGYIWVNYNIESVESPSPWW